jgi:hypothetical protein
MRRPSLAGRRTAMSKISDELRKFTNTYDLNSLQIYELKHIADRIDAEMAELPRDRDGVPIHMGDTVWLDDGRKAEVKSIRFDVDSTTILLDSRKFQLLTWRAPESFSHTYTDSWKRIADELEAWCDRMDVDGDACGKPRDLAKRIRRLAEREDERWQSTARSQ